ncbi:ROK family protein [Catellatospora bangladeshensis]|uniref:Glucokinase n=1 Tax=Catellatospora bangladeshensis TaxID=310355 RepID=A0A8J3NLN9_9ACTN|nr:ROK family protein [Catellatospora bangladeshensis]GIF84191.1 glucokinase [Catellatospora bangladeshensis]
MTISTGPGEHERLLGIDFGGTKMAVGVSTGDGRLLLTDRLPTLASRGAAQALDRALDQAERMVLETGGTLVAAGIATPGIVREHGIDFAPNVPGWEDLRLAEAVRARLGISRVRVANDLNAAAAAELERGALVDADPGLVIGLGTGVAAAVTVNGRVVPGFQGAAGEIAYAPTGGDWPGSPQPSLERRFSGHALDELAASLGIPGGAAGLCEAAERPGVARDALLDRVAALAGHVVTCCLLLDPQRIVLVGGVARSDLVRRLLVERITPVLPYVPEVSVSPFAQDAALIGSVLLARSTTTSPV